MQTNDISRKKARRQVFLLAAIAAGILAGCATQDPAMPGGAVEKVVGYHGQATQRIAELDKTRAEMDAIAAKSLAHCENIRQLMKDSEEPQGGYAGMGFQKLFDKIRKIEKGESSLARSYNSGEMDRRFNALLEDAGRQNVEIDALFEKARKSIYVRHIADREAKARNLKLWTENRERRDAVWGKIQDARSAFRESQVAMLSGKDGVSANLGKMRSVLEAMPEAFSVQYFDENDHELFKTPGGGRDERIAKPETTPRKDDWHRFKHWSKTKDGPAYEGFGRDSLADAPRQLWAVFEEVPVAVAFFADSAKGRPYSETKVFRTKGARFSKPEKDPARWGYRFMGWRREGDFARFSNWGSDVTDAATFVAEWEEAPFEVAFHDADGKERDVRNLRLSDAIPPVPFTADGYDYVGWSREKGGRQIAQNAKLSDCISEPARKLDLYALREAVAYTATFVGRDGATVAKTTGSATRKVSAPKAPDIPGYRFEGWFAGGDRFKDGPITGDIAVQARYAAVTYTATFKVAETGKDLGTAEFSVENPLVLPPAPFVLDFDTAWSLAGEGEALRPVDAKATKDITVYAVRTVGYTFWNWNQQLDEGKAVYGGSIEPPQLVDTRTRKLHNPDGWAFSSNESKTGFIDFRKFKLTEKDLAFCAVWPQDLWEPGKVPKVVTEKQWKQMLENAEREDAARRDRALKGAR